MNTPCRLVALLALCLLAPALAACTGLQGATAGSCLDQSDTSGASSDGFPAPGRVAVWQSSIQVLREQGFVLDPDLTTSTDGYIESRWKLSLQPFAGQGYRERVSIRVLPVKQRDSYFRLETNVMRQPNHNMVQPSSAIAAEWAAGNRNPGMERLINNQVEMMFVSGDVSSEYRVIHGLPEKGSVRDTSVKPPPPEPGFFEKLTGG